MIWFDLFRLQSPQLVEHSCSARMNWDLNKDIIIIIPAKNPVVFHRRGRVFYFSGHSYEASAVSVEQRNP